MRMRLKRKLKLKLKGMVPLLCLLFCGTAFPAAELRGDFPVVDLSNLEQNTLTALRMAQEIEYQIQLVQYQMLEAERYPSSSFAIVTGLLSKNLQALEALLADVRGIGYDLNRIDGQYNELFPDGRWDGIDHRRYQGYYQDWNRELTGAALVAMKSQGVVQRSRDYNDEAVEILGRSSGADGQVRQIQATNQMLGVMVGQLDGLTQALAFNARVSATAAAAAAQREEAEQSFTRRMWRGYGEVDTRPSPRYTTMPRLQQ